ncbi:MAG: hypothetical protein IJU03_04550 [Thermoguttaceae bacterium]|nr:hypothetical protein [Thermoguttaceae bacterium]
MKHSILFGIGTVLLSLGLACGGYFAGARVSEWNARSVETITPVMATASSEDSGVVIATGSFNSNIEALYYLDSQSGRLSAALISRSEPLVQKSYVRNIKTDLAEVAQQLQLPVPTTPKFLMTTGEVDVRNVGSVGNLSKAFLYVAEINSGIVIVYALPGANERDLLVTNGEIVRWTFARLSDGLQGAPAAPVQPAPEQPQGNPQLIDSGFYRTR